MRPAANVIERERANPSSAPGFTVFRASGRILYLRDDLAVEAPLIFDRLSEIVRTSAAGAGNRRSGFRLDINSQLSLFVRRSFRGGLMRLVNRDVYFGFRPRPLRELAIAIQATRRAIPIAEPLGALVQPLTAGIYRGAMITRALGGMTLWEFIETDDDTFVRSHILEEAARSIATMHRGGLFHADLNLHNLFVTRQGDSFAVVILDLDRAKLYPPPLKAELRQRNLQRLARSARKLDSDGLIFTPQALRILTGD